MRLQGFFLLTLLLAACEPMDQDYASTPSVDASPLPTAAVPPDGPLLEASLSLEAGNAKEVVRKLSALQTATPIERAWHRLLLGQAWFELEAPEKALRLLTANYEELRDARPGPDPTLSRVLARSLKKLGTYYRDRNQMEEAYTLHQLQWLYMRRFGSLSERHDALISLDVDAGLLRNYFASEQWLREAQLIASQMPEGPDRQRALIITWNNLSVSLQEMLRFQEAEAAVKESRLLSQTYDAKSGRGEFREIWALARWADVLGAWGLYQETADVKAAKPLEARALATAAQAVTLAENQGMPENDRVELEQRMRRYCGQKCRVEAPQAER